jgi:hypothetical protein
VLHNTECAEAVRKARMNGARINQVSFTELADAPEPLKRRTVKACHLEPVQMYVTVDRIGEYLRGSQDCRR